MSFLSLLTGSFSTPAGENPTVAMVEAAYRDLGLDARYINCDVAPEALADAVRGARAMGWKGFNCSLPHKVTVIEHLDELAESARLIGAVNCVVERDGRWVGENTDGAGFVASLRGVIDPAGRSLVLLGAGGAARAIGVEAALAGVREITVVNRNAERGAELAALIPCATTFVPWDATFTVPPSVEVVVNATSIGLAPDERIPDVDGFRAGLVVADVIPNPPRTGFLRRAEAAGATVLDGVGMLVEQGVIGIRHWTGREPDRAVMRQAAISPLPRSISDVGSTSRRPGPE
jgi:shikimate dehydrogenase